MPEKSVVSSNPISLAGSDGKHLMIPLGALYFDATGQLKADRWPLYGDYKALVDPFLQRLLAAQALQPGPVPTAKPALNVTAVTKGAMGISIELEFSNVVAIPAAPQTSTLDAKVTETQTYTGLTPDTLATTLGVVANGGTRPGLAFLVPGDAPALPKAGQYPLAVGDVGTAATVDVTKDGAVAATAFTLQARSADPAGAAIEVEVKNVDALTQTFDLIVSWTDSVVAKAVNSIAADFALVVTITPPDDGYRAPAPGKIALTGGADALAFPARPGSTTVLSSH